MSIDPSALRSLALPMFAEANDDDLRAVAARLASMNFRAGELVFARGDEANTLYVIQSGRVRVSVSSGGGRELAFRVAGPGDTVGEMAAFDGGTRSADATAIEPVRAFALRRADMDRLLSERPALARGVIGWLCRRLRETSDQLESVALLDVEQRVARFLLALSRTASRTADGRARIALDISQTELGYLLGASRPRINVALSGFEADGLIVRKGHDVFCDVAALTARAGVDPE